MTEWTVKNFDRTIYRAKEMNSPHTLRILFADAASYRAEKFEMEDEGEYILRFASTDSGATNALEQTVFPWDLVFYSSYMGNYKDTLSLVPALKRAWEKKKIKGVILTTPFDQDAREVAPALADAGIPFLWIPFRSDNHKPHAIPPPKVR